MVRCVVSLRFPIKDLPRVPGLVSLALGEKQTNVVEVRLQRSILEVSAKRIVPKTTFETLESNHAHVIMAYAHELPYIAKVSGLVTGE
jgi:hypothetical protein